MRRLLALAAAIAAPGCAEDPEDIEAAYVSPLEYRDYNCGQIGQELGRVSRRVHEITGRQEEIADDDAVAMGVGLILLWPALFFISGDDHAEELARLKGEYDAIQQAAIQKECDVAKQIEEARRLEEERIKKETKAAPTGPTYMGAGRSLPR